MEDASEKFGDTLDHANFLFKAYNPVDVEKVKQVDILRLDERRRRNKN